MDVLILHGWNLSSERYQPLIRALRKKRYRVIAPDFPGFGTAMLPSRVFALDDYVTFTADFIKKNNMKKPIVIGHSFGGRVGIKLAGTKKSLISGLVLTGVPGVRFASKAKLSFFLIAAKVGGMVFSLPLLRNLRDTARRFLYRAARANDFYHAKGVMRGTFKRIISEELITPMKKIRLPVLLVWGRNDGVTPLRIANSMNKIIPRAHLEIIEDATHQLPWTHPQALIKAVDRISKSRLLGDPPKRREQKNKAKKSIEIINSSSEDPEIN